MAGDYKILIAAAGIVLAVAGGIWGAWGPIAALAATGEVYWATRLALVAAIGAIVGAAGVMRGRVPTGSGLSLLSGVIVIGAGSAGAGIVIVLGSTLVFGVGEEPEPTALREALRNTAS